MSSHFEPPLPTGTGTLPTWQQTALTHQSALTASIPPSHRLPADFLNSLPDPRNVVGIPETCGLLTPRQIAITTADTRTLLAEIRGGVYTAVEVTQAFCVRASIAHQVTNCLSELLYDTALARAHELDEHLRQTGEPIGPLHGLPVSVKEHILIAGTRSTSGFVALETLQVEEDAHIVAILRGAGAVVHVKTTNPQSLLAIETNSNLFGRTTNPFNTTLSPGGSSGGEGALLAMRGSALGVGTDIGGSVRAPAAFSGLYSLRPSMARIPVGGLQSWLHAGMDSIRAVIGPMAGGVDALELFCEVALAAEPWLAEPALVNKPWDRNAISMGAGRPLRIGLMLTDGVIDPHPPIVRALKETAKALEDAGHTVVPWEAVDHFGMGDTIARMFFQDDGKVGRELLDRSGEPPTALTQFIFDAYGGTNLTLEQSWELSVARNDYRTKYAQLWNDAGIDAILCPAAPTASPMHDTSRYWGYTSVYNLLDYSAAVFPAGRVLDSDGSAPNLGASANYGKGSPVDLLQQAYREFWFERGGDSDEAGVAGPERYRFAPVGLQLVGRRLEEEKVLGMVRAVVEARRRAGLGEY